MKTKPIVILIITLLVVLGIILFLIWPVGNSIWKSYNELKKSENDIKLVNEKKQVLEALQNNPDLNQVNEIAIKYIPPDPQSGELIIELTAIAAINNVKIEQISMEKQSSQTTTKSQDEAATPTPKGKTAATPASSNSPATTTKELPFQLSISGTYANITAFLRGTETSGRLISIENLTLQSGTTSGAPATAVQAEKLLSGQISGKAYYREQISLEKNLANLQVSRETIDFFLNLKSWGQPINLPQESGFGRSNPFETY